MRRQSRVARAIDAAVHGAKRQSSAVRVGELRLGKAQEVAKGLVDQRAHTKDEKI